MIHGRYVFRFAYCCACGLSIAVVITLPIWLRKGYPDEAKPMSTVEVGGLRQELIWMTIEKWQREGRKK